MRFEDLKFEPLYDGVQAMVPFGKYELSVVKHGFSYGGSKGLYEIAVFEGDSQVELPGITQEGDTFKGFLTEGKCWTRKTPNRNSHVIYDIEACDKALSKVKEKK